MAKGLTRSFWREFVIWYRDRYGFDSMSDETARLWWDQLHPYDENSIKNAMTTFIGKKDFKFGFTSLIDEMRREENKENQENPLKSQEIEWQKTAVKDEDKRHKLNQKLIELMDAKSFDKQEYFAFMLNVHGYDEMHQIAVNLKNYEPEMLIWLKNQNPEINVV